jgi:LysM repeat protein
MAPRYRNVQQDDGRLRRLLRVIAPLLGGVFAAVVMALMLTAAVVLGMQDQAIVASTGATATPAITATAVPTRAVTVASPTPLPPLPSAEPASPTTLLVADTSDPSPSSSPTASASATSKATCVPPANWKLYTVRKGDTLSSVAWRYWTDRASIVQANCLKSWTLRTGQRIYVPNVTPRQVCGRPSGWVAYVIQKGDTLSSIARRVGSTVSALQTANCLQSDLIFAGATLWVPRLPYSPPPPPTSTPRPTKTPTATEDVTPTPTEDVTPTPTEDVTPTPTEDVTPTDPPEEPTDPPEEPTDPPATPTDPPATPTDPPATPTDPPATPTDPPATPTDPPEEPTADPAEP